MCCTRLNASEMKRQMLGADVNQKLFRGFLMTATVREGHVDQIFEILLKADASQPCREEALLDSSYYGRVENSTSLNPLRRQHFTSLPFFVFPFFTSKSFKIRDLRPSHFQQQDAGCTTVRTKRLQSDAGITEQHAVTFAAALAYHYVWNNLSDEWMLNSEGMYVNLRLSIELSYEKLDNQANHIYEKERGNHNQKRR